MFFYKKNKKIYFSDTVRQTLQKEYDIVDIVKQKTGCKEGKKWDENYTLN